MGELHDKARNVAQDAKGKAKKATGRATGDRSLQAEGHGDQAKASAKSLGERIKDIFR